MRKCFAECAHLSDGVVSASGREDRSTKVSDRDRRPDVLQHDASERLTGLDGEVVHDSCGAVGNLHVGKINRSDAVLVDADGGEGNCTAANLIGLVEGGCCNAADERHDDSVTLASSVAAEVTSEGIEGGELRHKCLEGDLGEDFVVKCDGGHSGLVVEI